MSGHPGRPGAVLGAVLLTVVLVAGLTLHPAGRPALAQQSPLGLLPELTVPRLFAPLQTFRRQQRARVATPDTADPVPTPRFRPSWSRSPGARTALSESCAPALARLGMAATARAAVIGPGGCGIVAPVEVAVLGADITLSQKAVLSCPTAKALAGWVEAHVRPAARAFLGDKVTGLRIAASYVCRTRNSKAGARLSEHARGRAIDISAIELSDHGWLEIGRQTGARGKFLAAIRDAACGPFTTVLGPGSDVHHKDHFHLDTAQRDNGSSYCK